MATCVKCGKEIEASAFCPNCGAAQQPQQSQQPFMPQQPYQPQPAQPQPVQQPFQPQQPMNAPYPYQVPAGAYPAAPYAANDSGSFGWAVLGFFFPIVGLVLYLVWKNTKPRCASKAGKGALVSVILSLISTALTTCAGIMMM